MAKLTIDERIKQLQARKDKAEALAKAKSDLAKAKKTLQDLRKKK